VDLKSWSAEWTEEESKKFFIHEDVDVGKRNSLCAAAGTTFEDLNDLIANHSESIHLEVFNRDIEYAIVTINHPEELIAKRTKQDN
jgi:hypothetical protein